MDRPTYIHTRTYTRPYTHIITSWKGLAVTHADRNTCKDRGREREKKRERQREREKKGVRHGQRERGRYRHKHVDRHVHIYTHTHTHTHTHIYIIRTWSILDDSQSCMQKETQIKIER